MQNGEKLTEESLINGMTAKVMEKGLDELEQVMFTKQEFAYLCSLSLRQVERLVEADHIRPVSRRPMQFNFECLREYIDYLRDKSMGT